MYVLIRYTIRESLVEMKHLRHEWSIIMYENAQKCNKTKEHSITFSHIWHGDVSKIKMHIWIRHTFCECLVKICVTKRKCRSVLQVSAVLPISPEKRSRKSNIPINIPGHYISWCRLKRRHRWWRRRQTEFQNYRQTDIS